MKPRIRLFIGRLSVVAATAFLIAFGVRRAVIRQKPSRTIEPGDALPSAVVFDAEGAARPYDEYLRKNGLTALIVFRSDCSQCQAEAMVWQEIADSTRWPIGVVAIAYSSDRQYPASLTRQAHLTIPVLLCDHTLPKAILAGGLPTIYVVSPDRAVQFAASGPTATEALRSWLRAGHKSWRGVTRRFWTIRHNPEVV